MHQAIVQITDQSIRAMLDEQMVWRCDVKWLADVMNLSLQHAGVSPSDGNPWRAEAERVVAAFGGRILEAPDQYDGQPGVVY